MSGLSWVSPRIIVETLIGLYPKHKNVGPHRGKGFHRRLCFLLQFLSDYHLVLFLISTPSGSHLTR